MINLATVVAASGRVRRYAHTFSGSEEKSLHPHGCQHGQNGKTSA